MSFEFTEHAHPRIESLPDDRNPSLRRLDDPGRQEPAPPSALCYENSVPQRNGGAR